MSNQTPNMPGLFNFFLKNPGLYFKGMKNQLKQGLPMDILTLMGDYIKGTKKADSAPDQKVANFTAGFPIEFLLAFDVWPGFPESSACTAGMCEITQPLIEHAESLGYSRDLCAYMKTSIGAFEKGYPYDFGGSPVADFYCGTNGVCDTHAKWFENEARKHGRPYFAMDVPCVVSGSDEARWAIDSDYIVAQLYDLIDFLEEQTGRRFNEERFMRIVNKSQEINRLYLEFFEYRKRIPAAEYFVFMRVFMFPVFAQWNQEAALKYYQKILDKMKKRYAQPPEKIGQPETYRLMWEGITLWYGSDFYKELARKGAQVVYELYTESSAFRRKKTATLEETFRQMAREFTSATYILDQERRIPFMEQKIKDYSIDGVILHANMSCRPSAAGLQDVKVELEKRTKKPVLILTCDMIDPRVFSEGQVRTRIDAFIEMMAENKKQNRIVATGGPRTPMKPKQIKGKTALISGAGSGIGLALAKEFGRRGATVIGTDIHQDRLDNMLRELKNSGATAFAYRVDHAKLDEVEALARRVQNEVGPVDILCCNAGVGLGGKFDALTLEDWKWVIDINLWGVIYLIHLFLPSMVERRQGQVLITASGAGLSPLGGMAPYCATKAALVSMTNVMRMDLKVHNINVSALCPGIIKTNVMRDGKLRGEHNRVAAIDFYDTKGIDPEKVARTAVKGLIKDKGIIPAPWNQVAIPFLLYRLSPDFIVGLGRMLFKNGRNFLGPYLKD